MISAETYTHEGHVEPDPNQWNIKKQIGSWLKVKCITSKFRVKSNQEIYQKYTVRFIEYHLVLGESGGWERVEAEEIGKIEAKEIRVFSSTANNKFNTETLTCSSLVF